MNVGWLRIMNGLKQKPFVVMPNHIHGIIEIIDNKPIVGVIHESPLRNKNRKGHYKG
jgi:REP element-mobilizing transposase RayT